MKLEKAKDILKKLNNGYSLSDCEVCQNYNELTGMCDKKKCDELIAIETVLQELEHLQKENEELKDIDLTTVHIKGVCDEKGRWRNKIKSQIEQLKREMPRIACNKGCNKCFDKDWNPLYRGREFVFCYAYQQIKALQDLLKEE